MIQIFRPLIALALGLLLGLPSWSQAPAAQPTHPYSAGAAIAGQYIVVFKPEVRQHESLAAQLVRQSGGQMLHVYSNAIKGFAARLPDAAVQALANNPNVQSIEQDQTVQLNETANLTTQNGATWGLNRVDQRNSSLDGKYIYEYTANGVYAFIVDTGILSTHDEFGGRVISGYTAIADGRGTTDCNGHGTHVAGTVGGSTYGVAKGVTLVPVRVLDCSGSGTNSGVITGVDWVAGQVNGVTAVANMSLGGGFSSALNAAVAGAVSKGVTFVVAAGNSNADACNYSPSSEVSAIAVGATADNDARASFSNYGSCVELFAPGVGIKSAWIGSNSATNTISGTSMASPHATGVAALLAASGVTVPTEVMKTMIFNSTPNKVTSAGSGSPNRLLFSLASQANVTATTVGASGISGSGKKSGTNWVATATVTVSASPSGAAISGATVSGDFSTGGSAVCVTTNNGSCTLTSSTIGRTASNSTFTLRGIMGSGLTYIARATTVTIARP